MQHCGLGYGFQVGPSKKRETTGNPQVILPRRSPVEAETTAHTHRTHSQWLKLVPEIIAEITGEHVQVNHFQTVLFLPFYHEIAM